jgi:hypothetical protein
MVIASRRNRKIPVTRRDDFLWTATAKDRQDRKGVENQIPVRLHEINL